MQMKNTAIGYLFIGIFILSISVFNFIINWDGGKIYSLLGVGWGCVFIYCYKYIKNKYDISNGNEPTDEKSEPPEPKP